MNKTSGLLMKHITDFYPEDTGRLGSTALKTLVEQEKKLQTDTPPMIEKVKDSIKIAKKSLHDAADRMQVCF